MATNHGAFEWIKVPDPDNPGSTIKKWVRDSWARKKIAEKQDALSTAQLAAVNSGITAAQLQSILDRLHALDGQ